MVKNAIESSNSHTDQFNLASYVNATQITCWLEVDYGIAQVTVLGYICLSAIGGSKGGAPPSQSLSVQDLPCY